MKAIVLKLIGKTEELKNNLVLEKIPIPDTLDGESLIKINYAALNHRDLWIVKGLYAGIKLPIILGSDCSGINTQTGDEVIVNPSVNWGKNQSVQSSKYKILGLPDNGTLAEYVKVNSENVFKKPEHLKAEEAAALPLAGLTAYRGLFTRAKLLSGEKILITGIGGGVSSIAMSFALAAGAEVYFTSGSDEKITFANNLGAKGGINYNIADWDKEFLNLYGEVDIAMDGTGGDTLSKIMNLVKPGGRVSVYGATSGNTKTFDVRKLFWKQINLLGTTMGSNEDFRNMLNFVSKNKIIPGVDKIFIIERYAEAFQRMNEAKQTGKIIIKIKE